MELKETLELVKKERKHKKTNIQRHRNQLLPR